MKRIVLIAFCALLLCACRPTPEAEPVVNKAENVMEDAIAASAAPGGSFETPARWTETVKINDNLSLTIDVPVECGDGDAHPVYLVSRRRMDADFLKRWAQAVYPDITGIRKPGESLAELQAELLKIERGEWMGTDADGNAVFEPYDPEEKQAMIDAVMQRIDALPAETTDQPLAPGYLYLQSDPLALHRSDGSVVRLTGFDAETGSLAQLDANRDAAVQKERWILEERGDLAGGPGPVTGISISQRQAEDAAREILERFGRTDFALAYAEKARCVSSFPNWGEIVSAGWMLYFTPTADGSVACCYDEQDAGEARLSREAFSAGWRQEVVRFYITDRGVEQAAYTNPYTVGETVNEAVALLPFSEIQERIRKMLQYGYAWTGAYDPDDSGVGRKLIVTRVALSSALVPKKDDPAHAYLIPAWTVYYISEHGQSHDGDTHVLIFNAIDGSVIDPQGN